MGGGGPGSGEQPRPGTGTRTGTAGAGEEATVEGTGRLERIVLKSGGRSRLVLAERVDWIEAEGVYARLHVAGESFLLRMPMHELETRLDARRFVRIHRSTIVNVSRIRELQPYFNREYVVLLRDGTRLKLSRGYRERLELLLGGEL